MWHEQSKEEVARKLKTNTRIGLAETEVEKRRVINLLTAIFI